MASGTRAGMGVVALVDRVVVALVFGVVLVQLVSSTPTVPARFDVNPLSEADAIQRLQRSTVEVVSLGCDLAVRQGTAVVVGHGQVLTNQHVVGSFRSVNVALSGLPAVTARTVQVSSVADVAFIQADALTLDPLPLAPHDPLPGEQVHFAGYPHSPPADALPDGLVVAPANVVDYVEGAPMGQPGTVMRIDVPARPGMSGGPVLDQAGRLAGLVFAVQSPTNDTLVIPASVLRRLLVMHDPIPTGRCAPAA